MGELAVFVSRGRGSKQKGPKVQRVTHGHGSDMFSGQQGDQWGRSERRRAGEGSEVTRGAA